MRVEFVGGEMTACLCSEEADVVVIFGRRTLLVIGTELGRGSGAGIPLELD